jgi:hypothetical protein
MGTFVIIVGHHRRIRWLLSVTESVSRLPPIHDGGAVCDKCDELDRRILKFRRFLAQPIDPLTTERLTAGITEMQASKAAFHPEKT